MKLLSFGEVLWDVYPDGKYLGGAPLNFAAHFVKQGGEAYLVSAVGNDPLGEETIREVAKLGVRTDYISVCRERETGRCMVTLNSGAVPSYTLLPDVAYDFISPPASVQCGVLYFGTLALRSRVNREAVSVLLSECGAEEIFVDLNIRAPFYSEETVGFCLRRATTVKISDAELPVVFGLTFQEPYRGPESAAREIAGRFPNLKLLVITLGEKGSFAYDCASRTIYFCPARKVKVASTVGAGDSFAAAFLAGRLNGGNIPDCLENASKISAYVVSQKDAVPEYRPEEFLKD